MSSQTVETVPSLSQVVSKTCSTAHMLTYSLGECANSLVMNGIFGFAMLCYTKAFGLEPSLASKAMAVSVVWEALSEPIMGHLSDNTRSRFGRRHQYMLLGGLLMAVCSYMIWAVPESFRQTQLTTFWYLVSMNLLLRTGLTMFFIPYMALGFEMCADYQGRSKIQGLRSIFNMAANFLGPAMAWTFFFQDHNGVQATTVAANYVRMGSVFALATVGFVLIVVIATFHWHEDTRNTPRHARGEGIGRFLADMKQIILDPYPRWVFVFIFIVCTGMVLVSSLQMYVYDDFMKFPANQKTIAHGSTMAGFAIGSALSVFFSRRMDKKGTVILGGLLSVVCSAMLGVLFLTGAVATNAVWHIGTITLPAALILFVIFHAGYWMGNGMLLPIATAMMADVSEIHLIQTGENRDGAYSSVFSLAQRLAISFSIFASGECLSQIHYRVPRAGEIVTQTPQTLAQLGMFTFVIGAAIALFAVAAIAMYPVNKRLIEKLRGELAVPTH